MPRPGFDIWEVERGVHTYTVAAVYAGLLASAHLAKHHGDTDHSRLYRRTAQDVAQAARDHLIDKNTGLLIRSITCDPLEENCSIDLTMDASLMYVWRLGLLPADDPVMEATVNTIEERLWIDSAVGGIARKENDWYHRLIILYQEIHGSYQHSGLHNTGSAAGSHREHKSTWAGYLIMLTKRDSWLNRRTLITAQPYR
ncbi:MAG: Glycosyl hydrolases family 15 [candidate division WS6 bacterium OLB20]|uniref:Glycosyl hydrolases family 15 n=1 Tax=candidate division WS6 bacterium OLB20 TaxID=1617426 RepID=A0A136M003_9BACT|nr:MAG: Glycosyl hydrolases family 15 [candidate division WS6 bacterium OLB20]